jgi:hypothetical protein
MTSLDGPTLTFSSRREMPTAVHAARRFFSIEPTEYAYMSAWSRDSIWRQGISLYLITLWARTILLPLASDAHTRTP